jgi:hypothetical protein
VEEKYSNAICPSGQSPSRKDSSWWFLNNRMPPPQKRLLQPLCHEHHLEMGLAQVPLYTGAGAPPTLAYACPDPDCLVHYSSSHGYFTVRHNGNEFDRDTMPEVWCPQDGLAMYLAEVLPEDRSFRLWKCPSCDSKRRNVDGLWRASATGNSSGYQPEI